MSHSDFILRQNLEQTRSRFWSKVKIGKPKSCWVWTHFTNHGYGMFFWNGRPWRAHRVAYWLTHGSIPEGKLILHICDVRNCVNPAHLYAGTLADNVRDAVERCRYRSGNTPGTAARGEALPIAKLTDEKVKTIRALFSSGESHRDIATLFGVTHGTIGAVIRGKTWRHVPLTYHADQ